MSNSIWVLTDLTKQKLNVVVGEERLEVPLADVTPAVGALLSALQQLDMEPENVRAQKSGEAGYYR